MLLTCFINDPKRKSLLLKTVKAHVYFPVFIACLMNKLRKTGLAKDLGNAFIVCVALRIHK